jgi:hypothetical protein
MEGFGMDVRDQELTKHPVMQKQIEDSPSGQYKTLKIDADLLLHLNKHLNLRITYEQIQALSVFGPCVFAGKNLSTYTKRGIEEDGGLQRNTHGIFIVTNSDKLKELWNEGSHQEAFSWILLPQ